MSHPLLTATYIAEDWDGEDRATGELERDGVVWGYASAIDAMVLVRVNDEHEEPCRVEIETLIHFLADVGRTLPDASTAEAVSALDPRGVRLEGRRETATLIPAVMNLYCDGRRWARASMNNSDAWLHFLDHPQFDVRVSRLIPHLGEVGRELRAWQENINSRGDTEFGPDTHRT